MSDFDGYAGSYDAALNRGIAISGEDKTFFARKRVEWLGRCLAKLGTRADTVLDYGCGTGTATPFLLNVLGSKRVVGIDSSVKSLEVARAAHAHLPVDYQLVSEYRPEPCVDVVFCNGVLHHVDLVERRDVVGCIASSLRTNGFFSLWENNPWSPAARLVMSRIPFDEDAVMVWPREARTLVSSAGMDVVSTDFFFVFPRFLKALRVTESMLRRLPFGAQYQILSRQTRKTGHP